MPKVKILDSDSDEEEDGQYTNQLTINKAYAERYENWRKKEEYQKLKDKYGESVLSEASELSSDGSSSSDEDSDPEILNQKLNQSIFDENFLKVYGALKRKDPKIYEENFVYSNVAANNDHDSSDPKNEISQSSKQKKMTLMDYHKKLLKEKKGITEEDEAEHSASKPMGGLSYHQELMQIRSQFKAAVDGGEESDDGELISGLKPVKSKNIDNLNDVLETPTADDDIQYLKNYWKKDTKQLDEKDCFLRDYILNKKYLDSNDPKQRSKSAIDQFFGNFDKNEDDANGEDSEPEEETKVETVVAKHHFEEPGAFEIKRYPRTMDSARDLVKDEKSSKRKEARERKKKEKGHDLKMFSQLRKEEIQSKLKKLSEVSGNKQFINDHQLDLDMLIDDNKDFDPSKYDEYMEKLFSDNYYDDKKGCSDSKKPQFEFMEGIDDEIEKAIESGPKPAYEESVGNVSDDEDEDTPGTSRKSRRKQRKELKKKRIRFKPVDIDKLPVFEDIIGGDLPTRFKYRKVEPLDFGLSTEELLLAQDKELNQWASLKKTVGYREFKEERSDAALYSRRKDDFQYKRKILKSLFEEEKEESNNEDNETRPEALEKVAPKKKKKRKHKKVNKSDLQDQDVDGRNNDDTKQPPQSNGQTFPQTIAAPPENGKVDPEPPKEKQKKPVGSQQKRKRPNRKKSKTAAHGLDVNRLQAYGLSKNTIKRRKLI